MADQSSKKSRRTGRNGDDNAGGRGLAGFLHDEMKKLTKPEKLVNEQMLALLEWAADHPKSWHDIGKLPQSRKAAELLAKRGVIEVWPETNRYRLKPGRQSKAGWRGMFPP